MAREKIEGKLVQRIKGDNNQEVKIFYLEKEDKYFTLIDGDTDRVLLITDELLLINVERTYNDTLKNIEVPDNCRLTSHFQLFGSNLYNTQDMKGYFYIFESLWAAKIVKVSLEDIIEHIKEIAHIE